MFRRHSFRVGKNRNPVYRAAEPVVQGVYIQQLREELKSGELLGETDDSKSIYLVHDMADSAIMREINRLMGLSIYAFGIEQSNHRDFDTSDSNCMHLILWDEQDLEIVAAYLFSDSDMMLSIHGIDGIHTSKLFRFNRYMKNYFYRGLEVGRSFVQPKYWGKRSLDYLWYGIGALLKKNPQYRYLFGAVSISNRYSTEAIDLLVYFYRHYFGCVDKPATALNPYRISEQADMDLGMVFGGDDYSNDLVTLKGMLANLGYSMPGMHEQYAEFCEPGGVIFSDFNIDHDLADRVDSLVIVDIEQAKACKRHRYLQI